MLRVLAPSILRSGSFSTPKSPCIPYLFRRGYADQTDKSFKSLLDEISASIKPRTENTATNRTVNSEDNFGKSFDRTRREYDQEEEEDTYPNRSGGKEYGGDTGVYGRTSNRGGYGSGRGRHGDDSYGGGSSRGFGSREYGSYGGNERGAYNGGGRGNYGDSGRGGYGSGSGGYGGYGGGRGGLDLGGKLQPVQWKQADLSPITKEIYTEHPEVKAMSQTQAAQWRKTHSITIRGNNCPNPISSFAQSSFPSEIQKILISKYNEPTPIQAQGWPLALAGRDMVGSSQTGSGKTIGFILPALAHITAQLKLQPHRWSDGPIAVVLAPTRELALQIITESTPYTKALGLNAAAVFGGEPRGPQQAKLRQGVHLLVATPGRLIDFLSDGSTNLQRVSYVVLDEADRMLDMGFEPQIRQIMGQLRPDRQTLMWSATWPFKVQALANEFFNDPIIIHVGSTDLRANPNVRQKIHITSEREKQQKATELIKELHREGPVKTLVFCATKDMTEHLHYMLASQGFNTAAIHGGKTQAARMNMLSRFRTGHTHILVATDVAARGLDIDNIQHVINYDFPSEIEDYIHRIGRTGRAGKTGSSHTFLSHERHPGKTVSELIKVLHDAGQEISQELRSYGAAMPNYGGGGGGGGGKRMFSRRY